MSTGEAADCNQAEFLTDAGNRREEALDDLAKMLDGFS
jgi:hypothetical protein